MTQFAQHDAIDLANILREKSKSLGFDALKISDAEELARQDFFDRWLDQGFGGKMSYLYRNRKSRVALRQVWPEVKSVVTLAMNYHVGINQSGKNENTESKTPLIGRISRYAWGRDYHKVIRKRLIKLALLTEQSGLGKAIKCYVDTGPILERELAAQSGLGWIGKNTLVLNSDLGSWFFIGVLLLNVKLPSDSTKSDLCGSCTKCIQACPTGAIIKPYVMDSSRCISYLNIELQGWIPVKLRSLMGNWIFGCDDCQTVCPYNDNTPISEIQDFRPREQLEAAELIELLKMDKETFDDRFRGSALKRARWVGIVRNAAIALGNSGENKAVGPLGEALRHTEPIVRGHSAWALGRLGGSSARTFLEGQAGKEYDENVKNEIESALFTLKNRELLL